MLARACRQWAYLKTAGPVPEDPKAPPIWAGTYIKDGHISSMVAGDAAEQVKAVIAESMRPGMVSDNALDHILASHVSGVSRNDAWVYAGSGAAGTHMEDAFMQFVHFMVRAQQGTG